MSIWFLVAFSVLVSLIGAHVLSEWVVRRYSLDLRRRIAPYAVQRPGDAEAPSDPFAPRERSEG